MAPHFYWTMLTSKDRDTLIEQSATLSQSQQSLILLLKTVSSFYSYIVSV